MCFLSLPPKLIHKLVVQPYGSIYPATNAVKLVPPNTIGNAKIISCQKAVYVPKEKE